MAIFQVNHEMEWETPNFRPISILPMKNHPSMPGEEKKIADFGWLEVYVAWLIKSPSVCRLKGAILGSSNIKVCSSNHHFLSVKPWFVSANSSGICGMNFFSDETPGLVGPTPCHILLMFDPPKNLFCWYNPIYHCFLNMSGSMVLMILNHFKNEEH